MPLKHYLKTRPKANGVTLQMSKFLKQYFETLTWNLILKSVQILKYKTNINIRQITHKNNCKEDMISNNGIERVLFRFWNKLFNHKMKKWIGSNVLGFFPFYFLASSWNTEASQK